MENKLASSLVVPLGKALSGIPLSWSGRQTPVTPVSSSQRFDGFLVIGRLQPHWVTRKIKKDSL